jgi:hypothetical protein
VFKRSAAKLATGLDKEAYAVEMAEKKGAFVVHLDIENEPIIELMGLVRPFTKVKPPRTPPTAAPIVLSHAKPSNG